MNVMVLFAMVLISSATMSAQNATPENNPNHEVATTTTVSENANMNLFSWFMGTKQTPNTNLKNDDSNSVKKQMINSGIEPNRLLIKSFLKKMSNYNQVIV